MSGKPAPVRAVRPVQVVTFSSKPNRKVPTVSAASRSSRGPHQTRIRNSSAPPTSRLKPQSVLPFPEHMVTPHSSHEHDDLVIEKQKNIDENLISCSNREFVDENRPGGLASDRDDSRREMGEEDYHMRVQHQQPISEYSVDHNRPQIDSFEKAEGSPIFKSSSPYNDAELHHARMASPVRGVIGMNDLDIHSQLQQKLLESERDAHEAGIQVTALKDALLRAAENPYELSVLARIRETADDKLSAFERSNRALRLLLREQQRLGINSSSLLEQRDGLLKKISSLEVDRDDCAAACDLLRTEVNKLHGELDSIDRLRGNADDMRAHLQKQYRLKEAECNRLQVQIRDMHKFVSASGNEVDKYFEERAKIAADKETLKKAARAYKQRAQRGDAEIEGLRGQLVALRSQMAEKSSEMEELREKNDNALREMAHLRSERLRCAEEAQSQVERSAALQTRVNEVQSKLNALERENERLKAKLDDWDEKGAALEKKIVSLKDEIGEYERQAENYRRQIAQLTAEQNAKVGKLEREVKESERVRVETEENLEEIKERLEQKLDEFRGVPETLQANQLLLGDADERLAFYEQRCAQQSRQLAELQQKLDKATNEAEVQRGRFQLAAEENGKAAHKIADLERRLKDAEKQNLDSLTALSKREGGISALQARLEEKARENSVLTRQLEAALNDARRMVDTNREKTATRERTMAQRIGDLEAQLAAAKADAGKLKSDREELERRLAVEVRDLRDRLDAAHSQNRSMQNYVNFLKRSYAQSFPHVTADVAGGNIGNGSNFPPPPNAFHSLNTANAYSRF